MTDHEPPDPLDAALLAQVAEGLDEDFFDAKPEPPVDWRTRFEELRAEQAARRHAQ